MSRPVALELCAGAGGQALGLERAGLDHVGLVELDKRARETLRLNRESWNVIERDLRQFNGAAFRGVDLLAGGLPCPPFSVAGKQLGEDDERNLFPQAIRLISEARPIAVMIENVRGFLDAIFADYRKYLVGQLKKLGYQSDWRLLNASDYGVPQLRPRVVFVAIRKDRSEHFQWPKPKLVQPPTVGELLYDLIASRGWKGANAWRVRAQSS
jgi:DNA (cytosine-5)-methyltransferase 1